MFRTKEIRWFFHEENQHLKYWFERREFDTCHYREDRYLILKDQNVGIKLRDDKIEIKQEIGSRAKGCLTSSAWGYFKNYAKWSFDANAKDPLRADILDGKYERWITISKNRMAVQLVDTSGELSIRPISEETDTGCQVEYASIQINHEKWYTFGLEWFGEECIEINEPLISRLMNHTQLTMKQSMGYSDFIAKHKF